MSNAVLEGTHSPAMTRPSNHPPRTVPPGERRPRPTAWAGPALPEVRTQCLNGQHGPQALQRLGL